MSGWGAGWIPGGLLLLLTGCGLEGAQEPITRFTILNVVVDLDGDGATADVDCNDQDPSIFPGAPEIAYDGIDQDCDGRDLIDVDHDGFVGQEAGGPDCADQNPSIHPGALDLPGDDIDQDCSGVDYVDDDHDGYSPLAGGQPDCDDHNPTVYPGADEVLDGQDNDCDGSVDEVPFEGELPVSQSGGVLEGAVAEGAVGSALLGGMDLTGDGIDDLLVASPGQARVMLVAGSGGLGGGGALPVLASFTGVAGEGLGTALAAGDLDGDGHPDLAISASGAEAGSGRVYLMTGRSWGAGQVVDLSLQALALSGGSPGDRVGAALAGGADLNGDGLADLVVGAPGVSWNGQAGAGAAYVYLGRAQGEAGPATLPEGTAGAVYGDGAGQAVGTSLAVVDLNGDGMSDVLVGAPGGSGAAQAGKTGIFYGHPGLTGNYGLGDADAVIVDDGAAATTSAAGQAVMGGCDVDGDGYDDVVVAAPAAASGAGKVYLFRGGMNRLSGIVPLSGATASYAGGAAGEGAGSSLSCAGDVNGDGYGDVLVGAPGRQQGAGGAYVVYGAPGGWTKAGSFAQGATVFIGASGDRVGGAVAGSDLNGDGQGDAVIGAPGHQSGATPKAGAAYVFMGSRATGG